MKKQSAISLITITAFILIFVGICFLFTILHGLFFGIATQVSEDIPVMPTVIIDAGHGGEDGGTTGLNGALEKDLNLAIAKKLKLFLDSMGIPCVLTRSEDVLLYDKSEDFRGHKKILDAKERKRIAESYENAIFVSIHQNAFPVEKYSGFQIYYSPNNAQSRKLSVLLEENLRSSLQKDNNRASVASSGRIYLLDKLNCPSVLIECGFLSNTRECSLLCSEEYQNQLCAVIASSLAEFIDC